MGPIISDITDSYGSFHVLFVHRHPPTSGEKMNFLEALLPFRKQHVQFCFGLNIDILIEDSGFSDNLGVGTYQISHRTF
jgi:5'(3')-deoxyribonucleotidase